MPVLTALPGAAPLRVSAASMVRYAGTNRSSTAASLLPVPRRPEARQVSRTVYSPFGTRNRRNSGDSAPSTMAAKKLAQAWSMPLPKGQRPLSR